MKTGKMKTNLNLDYLRTRTSNRAGFADKSIVMYIKEARTYAKQYANIQTGDLVRNKEYEKAVRKNMLLALKLTAVHTSQTFTLSELLSPALEGLWEAVKTYDPERGAFSTWAYYKINHKILRYKEQAGREFINKTDEFPIMKQGIKYNELKEVVKAMLPKLNEKERFVIEKHYFEDWGFDTISSSLGMHLNSIYYIHKRALSKLRDLYEAV